MRIAADTVTVTGPAGVPVKVVGGKPVPLHLVNAYEAEGGEYADKAEDQHAAPEAQQPSAEAGSESVSAEQLVEQNDRESLDRLAEEAGVENPESLPNKQAVAEAIVGAGK
jgi:hypothetical protein